MDIKIVGIGVLAFGAVAIGGIVLWNGDGQGELIALDTATSDVQSDNYGSANYADGFADQADVERKVPTRGGGDREGIGFGDMAARLATFDLDGDGFLSEDERAEMRRARMASMLERFDLDGDGELSREERMAARQDRFEQSARGQQLMREFDLDGDGELNEEEQAAMDAYMDERRQERREEQIAQYDTDGDGELSREERTAQRDDFMSDLTDEFDADGDGQLNIDEQLEAMNTMRDRREIDRFVDQYDADGDGSMGAGDYTSFLNDYSNGNMRADVNGDGVVNTLDMTAYTEMVSRSGNRP